MGGLLLRGLTPSSLRFLEGGNFSPHLTKIVTLATTNFMAELLFALHYILEVIIKPTYCRVRRRNTK